MTMIFYTYVRTLRMKKTRERVSYVCDDNYNNEYDTVVFNILLRTKREYIKYVFLYIFLLFFKNIKTHFFYNTTRISISNYVYEYIRNS